MASSTTATSTTTGIDQSYLDKLQTDSSTAINGDIANAYQSLVAAGIPQQQVAGLSAEQLKALKGLQGNDLTQAFQQQLGQQTSNLTEGSGILSQFANGQNAPNEASLIAGANQIANSSGVQAQVDAMDGVADTNRQNLTDQVNRQLNESSLPSLYRSTQDTGGMGSSRSAIAEGIARRGASETISQGVQAIDQNNAAMQAQLRGNVFNTGLQTAMQSQQANAAREQSAAGSLAGIGMQAGQNQATLDQQQLANLQQGGALTQTQAQNVNNAEYANAQANRNKGVGDVNQLQGMLSNLRGISDTTTTQNGTAGSLNSTDYMSMIVPAAVGALGSYYSENGSLW